MTYRYGRTSKGRYAATLRGVTAYQPITAAAMKQPGSPVAARGYAASAPMDIPVGCVYDAKLKKIVCTDTGDPLGYNQSTRKKGRRRR